MGLATVLTGESTTKEKSLARFTFVTYTVPGVKNKIAASPVDALLRWEKLTVAAFTRHLRVLSITVRQCKVLNYEYGLQFQQSIRLWSGSHYRYPCQLPVLQLI